LFYDTTYILGISNGKIIGANIQLLMIIVCTIICFASISYIAQRRPFTTLYPYSWKRWNTLGTISLTSLIKEST